MFQRLIGPILTAAGGLILAVSVLANAIGQFALARSLGIGGDPGFGTEQTAGVLLGVAVLAVGIWVWSRPSEGKSLTVSYLAAFLAFAVVIGGPLYLILKSVDRSLRPGAAVEPCVEVKAVPSSAGSAGHKRLDYGVRITNAGRVAVRVDSIWLQAFRDTAASLLFKDEIVVITDGRWEQIDSIKFRAGDPQRWGLKVGARVQPMRSLVLPPEALRPLYRFMGRVFFQHSDPEHPVVAFAGPDWADNFTDECW
jgi:hypothetical protein